MQFNSNGLILYEGRSRIDNKPIFVAVTGLKQCSTNSKTGPMAQTWILRADVHPHEAIDRGYDYSICGTCPLRRQANGQRLCYVTQMPLSQIYSNYKQGKYKLYSKDANKLLNFRYQTYGLRIGSYGDPCAVPLSIWQQQLEIVPKGFSHTGYTRRWHFPENQFYKSYLMASVFTESEAALAQSLGWQTYRVKQAYSPLLTKEISCPASTEAGRVTTCSNCHLCSGNKLGVNIVINAHGGQKHRWGELFP